MNKNSEKPCRVCGDRSTGKNFGVYSCESCKAFFRRNAYKIDEFICHFSEECEINSVTRKFCRKCRLKKCFIIGMKKEWILNETEREIRKNKINENRLKRCVESTDGLNGDNSIESVANNDNTRTSSDHTIEPIDLMALIDETLFASDETESVNTQMVIESDYNEVSNETFEKIADYEMSVVPIGRPITDYNNNLNEIEGMRISEVINATNHLQEGLARTGFDQIITTFPEVIKTITLVADQEIRKLVKTCKSLKSFNEICETDRISLLKIGTIEMALLRTAFTYDASKNSWIFNVGNMTCHVDIDLMKEGKRNCYHVHKEFHSTFPQIWDSDPIILHLLTVILLYNPSRPGLKHKDLVKMEQYVYIHLLKRYLQLKYRSECEANSRLLCLINSLETVQTMGKIHILNFNEDLNNGLTLGRPDMFLLQEVCDLKAIGNESDSDISSLDIII